LLATGDENLLERREQGFRILGLGMDSGLLLRSLKNALQTVGGSTSISTSLDPKRRPPE
jgi:hypothetical protein